jgi:exosortase
MIFADAIRRQKFYLLFVLFLLVVVYAEIVPEMVIDWYKDDNYSHGFIVPLIAGYFIYIKRKELATAEVEPCKGGLLVILLGLAQLLVSWLGTEYFNMRLSLIVVMAGLILFLFGREVLKIFKLPLFYLVLMIPIPYIIYDSVAFPLKLFVTKVSVAFLEMVGVVLLREGNIIMFPTITLEVADACSGLRSLMSLIALSVAYAYFIKVSTLKRWILIFSAVPFAIITNIFRVIITGLLAQWWGAKAAEGFFHEFAGLTIFVMAFVMLLGLGAILSRVGSSADEIE